MLGLKRPQGKRPTINKKKSEFSVRLIFDQASKSKFQSLVSVLGKHGHEKRQVVHEILNDIEKRPAQVSGS